MDPTELEEVQSHRYRGDAKGTSPCVVCPSNSPGSYSDSPSRPLSQLLFLLQTARRGFSGQQQKVIPPVPDCLPPAVLVAFCLVAVMVQRNLLAKSHI